MLHEGIEFHYSPSTRSSFHDFAIYSGSKLVVLVGGSNYCTNVPFGLNFDKLIVIHTIFFTFIPKKYTPLVCSVWFQVRGPKN